MGGQDSANFIGGHVHDFAAAGVRGHDESIHQTGIAAVWHCRMGKAWIECQLMTTLTVRSETHGGGIDSSAGGPRHGVTVCAGQHFSFAGSIEDARPLKVERMVEAQDVVVRRIGEFGMLRGERSDVLEVAGQDDAFGRVTADIAMTIDAPAVCRKGQAR
jgi:hypothetical protein